MDNKNPSFTQTFRYQITDMLDIVKKSGKAVVFLILVYDKLSPKDKEFLFAMAQDTVQSLNEDIIARLGKDKSYVSMYRARLISLHA